MLMIEKVFDRLLETQKSEQRLISPEELVAEINSAIENIKATQSTLPDEPVAVFV